MYTESTEMYLITVYRLTRQASHAHTKDIASLMGVSPPSASEQIKRLAKRGYLNHEWREGATLTAKGEQIALNVLRKHRLVETFLVQMADYEIDEIHDEACAIEHAISDKLANRLETLLNYPTIDPHGHPIPTQTGKINHPTYRLLSDVSVDETATIQQVSDWQTEQLRYLREIGLVPGVSIKVIAVAPFDGPLTLQVGDNIVAVAREIARTVGVTTT